MEIPEADKESPKSGPKAAKPEKEPAKPVEKKDVEKKDAGRRKQLRWGVVGLAVLVALVAWLATRGGDGSSEAEPASAGFAAKVVSEAELEEIAASAGHPVYWAGPAPQGTVLEASETAEGRFMVRYLKAGAKPGSDRAGTLTIGSYPLPDAVGDLKGFAARKGAIVRRASDGRAVVSNVGAPGSVYLADPGGKVQIEVYEPSPKRAMGLALSGKVQPAG